MSTLSFTDAAVHSVGRPIGPACAPPADLISRSARRYLAVRSILDRVTALTLLVLTAPLIALGMLLVKLTSRGPALYSQTRLGRHGLPFTIYKIRTMAYDCESLTGPRWSTNGDTRVTALGRWMRCTHVDELPQLWNVLRGDMSLIGPRPERPEFVPKLEQAIPHYRNRLQVRPGVTGLAQVQLPPDSDLDSVLIKTAYDLHYIRGIGVMLDMRIAGATFFKLTGLPFGRLRTLFRFPERQTIEQGYRALSHSAGESSNGKLAGHEGRMTHSNVPTP
jgi:lipopolysaccharide/colanic/teichoic acid biosynthesis glycosyltransferase